MPTLIRSIRPVGDRAVLVQLGGLTDVLALAEVLRERPLPGQLDVVAAAATVLVTADTARAAGAFPALLRSLDLHSAATGAGGLDSSTLVTIDVVYDGEDLDEVGELTGLGRSGVIEAHTRQVWTAAFGGFAPGFAYLAGDGSLLVPRRSTPRPGVPAGAVALADNFSAVYPRVTPGGWQLIGRTEAALWSIDRDPPALVQPGDRVQFRAVPAFARSATVDAAGDQTKQPREVVSGADSAADLTVVQPGLQTTVQDLGRPGLAHLGVTGSGALDRGSLRRANRLVGNQPSAAVLENALGGLVLDAHTDQVLAVAGASVLITISRADGADRVVATDAPFAVLAGERLSLAAPRTGVRSYVAVRGGLDVPPVLGSRSTDSMSGIGPAPLVVGSALRVLPAPPTSVVGAAEQAPEPPAEVSVLRYVPGPRADWFTAGSLVAFNNTRWRVTLQSNRIGLRLDGPPLVRARTGELPSEGTVAGAVQLPASGVPVLFLADHPVTGGYPVLGVVVQADLDLAAQLGAGARIRFTPVEIGCAPEPDPTVTPNES